MSDKSDRIFNSMSRALEVGRGNDWGSNKVWVNDPDNTVAICHNGTRNCYFDRYKRDAKTMDRWAKIGAYELAKHKHSMKKRQELALIRKAEERRINEAAKERVRQTWLAEKEKKKKAKKGAKLLDDGKQPSQKARAKKASKKQLGKFHVRLELGEALDMLKRRDLPSGPADIHQSLVDMYFKAKMIGFNARVTVNYDGSHFTISEK